MLVEAENQESRIEHPYYSNTDYLSIITFAILFFLISFLHREVKPGKFTEKSVEETKLDVLDSVFFGLDLRVGMWYDDKMVFLKAGFPGTKRQSKE